MRPSFFQILFCWGLINSAFCGLSDFPVYKEPLTPYEEFERAIFKNQTVKAKNYLSSLSEEELGLGLFCTILFDRGDIALDILKSGKPISDEVLERVYRATAVGRLQKAKDIKSLITAHLKREIVVASKAYSDEPEFIKLARELKNPRLAPWLVVHFIHYPGAFFTHRFSLSLSEAAFKKGDISPKDINSALLLASLLSLKTLSREGALAELKKLQQENPDLFRGFDEDLFLENLGSIFQHEPFMGFARFGFTRWAGHVSRTEKGGGKFEDKKKLLPSEEDVKIEVFPVKVAREFHELKYQIFKTEKEPKSIVVSVYGGFDKNFPGLEPDTLLRATLFPDRSIASIALQLWDHESEVSQGDQFKRWHLGETHISYLCAVSQFLNHIKTLYPKAKIFLYGESFGGFFVTSYAFLQSILESKPPVLLETIYSQDMCHGVKRLFSSDKITPIDGFISFAGALSHMGQILQNDNGLQRLRVPGFFAYNYDDDRVVLTKEAPFLWCLPENYTEFYFNREGADPYGADMEQEEVKFGSTTRGHFAPSHSSVWASRRHAWVELMDSEMRFIQRVGEKKPLSAIEKAVQTRRRNLYLGRDHWEKKRNIQEFLSGSTNSDSMEHIGLALIEMSLLPGEPIKSLLEKTQKTTPALENSIKDLLYIESSYKKSLDLLKSISDKKEFIKAYYKKNFDTAYDKTRNRLYSNYLYENLYSELVLRKLVDEAKSEGDHRWNEANLEEFRSTLSDLFRSIYGFRRSMEDAYKGPWEGLLEEISKNPLYALALKRSIYINHEERGISTKGMLKPILRAMRGMNP